MRRKLIIISLLLIVTVLFLLKCGLFLGDNLLAIVPHKIFVLENLKMGIFPLWNPHQWAGFPEVADVTFGLFNPFSSVHFIFPDMTGATIAAVISYVIVFTGSYYFFLFEKIDKKSSLLGAIVFTLSGSMINISADIIRLESICFLPWILLFAKRGNFVSLTLLLTLNLLVGQTQHFYMTIVFVFAFLIFDFFKSKNWRSILKFILAAGFSFGFSGFMILPQLELLKLSSRANTGAAYNTIWSLNPLSFVRFFIANFWGRHNEGSFWGPDVTYTFGYIGFFTLIIVLWKIKFLWKTSFFYLLTSLLIILIALGKYFPFVYIFQLIPGFSLFRNPVSWLIIYSFSMAYLLAKITNSKELFNEKRLKNGFLAIGICFVIPSIIIIGVNFVRPEIFFQIFQFLAKFIHKNLSLFHNVEVDQGIAFFITRNLLVIGLLSFLLYKKFSKNILIFVIFLDLLIFSTSDLSLAKNTNGTFSKVRNFQTVNFLKKNLNGQRFLSTSEFVPVRGMSIYMTDFFRRPPYFKKEYWSLSSQEISIQKKYWRELSLLPPDINVAYSLPSMNGYAGFYLKSVGDYFLKPSDSLSKSALRIQEIRKSNMDPGDPSRINFNYISLADDRINEMSVKYILSGEKLNLPEYSEISEEDGIFIYENLNAKKRANIFSEENLIVSNPPIVDKNPNEVLINLDQYNFHLGDYLVLRDTYYPGWNAYDQNGGKLQILAYQNIFRKIQLNKKTKMILFKYEPGSFYLGLNISAVSAIIFIILISISKFYIFRRSLLGRKNS